MSKKVQIHRENCQNFLGHSILFFKHINICSKIFSHIWVDKITLQVKNSTHICNRDNILLQICVEYL